jgi:hypothetical protein
LNCVETETDPPLAELKECHVDPPSVLYWHADVESDGAITRFGKLLDPPNPSIPEAVTTSVTYFPRFPVTVNRAALLELDPTVDELFR